MRRFLQSLPFLTLTALIACGNPTNQRAVSLDELDGIQAEDQKMLEAYAPRRTILTAAELMELSGCSSVECVQLFMKDLSPDFVAGYKGEYYAQFRITIQDTAGNELSLPASTFYVNANTGVSWRAAHTVHTKEQGDSLLHEFTEAGFRFTDQGYYLGLKSRQQRYVSGKYPGKILYITATFQPWYSKGLYINKVTWPCYVFEVYND